LAFWDDKLPEIASMPSSPSRKLWPTSPHREESLISKPFLRKKPDWPNLTGVFLYTFHGRFGNDSKGVYLRDFNNFRFVDAQGMADQTSSLPKTPWFCLTTPPCRDT